MRRTLAGLLALGIAAASVSSALAAGSSPVLGATQAFSGGQGFGTSRPSTVFLGGDPTGRVTKLSWHGWGSGLAVGSGLGWCPGQSVAAGHACAASLHVYNLGTCRGRRAYRMMAFYFKSSPHWALGSRWNVCNGQSTS